MSHPDPVSWKVVERGWRVLGRSGEELGAVDEVVGDLDADIFNGIRVSSGLLDRPTYVAAERVEDIRVGELVLAGDDLSELASQQ